MDKKAIVAARIEYNRATESLTAIATANDFTAVETHWAAFLVAAGRVFTKLEQGAKLLDKSKAWWGNQLHRRRTDPLLRYLWHARNADEHTLQDVTQRHHGSAKIVEPTKEEIAALNQALEKETRPWTPLGMVEWLPDHVELLPVVDRGVRYDPPASHLGNPIVGSSPAHLAELMLTYLDAMVKEADELTV
jgi:hypothetical protein